MCLTSFVWVSADHHWALVNKILHYLQHTDGMSCNDLLAQLSGADNVKLLFFPELVL